MGALTNKFENVLIDWLIRAQAIGLNGASAAAGTGLANTYIGLITTSKGPRANSTAYALNDTLSLTANDGKTHLYKCTTAGTTAASQAALYPGTNDEAITDGTATMTEQYTALEAGTYGNEVTGAGYARVGVVSSLANWAGTQGPGTTVASSGTNGTTSNNGAITYGPTTASWGFIAAAGMFDSLSGGSQITYGTLPAGLVKTVNSGDASPSFAAAQLTFQIDN